MEKHTKLCVVVSDLHCGSTVGLLPPGFVTRNGNEVGLNKLQQWLWKSWLSAGEWAANIVGDDPFVVVSNGDLIDGYHHRTKEVWSVDEEDHVDAAKKILNPLIKKAKDTYVVFGTEVHTKNLEENFANEVGAVKDPETGKPCFLRLEMDINGCLVFFSHHIGTTSRVYLEASQLSIALGNAQLEYARAGHRKPDMCVFSHRHRYGFYDDGVSACLVTGAWQFLTRFGGKVVPAAALKPAMQILDWRESEPGDLPRVHRKVFIPEKQPIVMVK